jgi:hypothetical protein
VPKYFLVDGQQRVTALASVMLERDFLKRLEPEIEEQLPPLYANVKRFPNEIESGYDKYPWVLMNDVFNRTLRPFFIATHAADPRPRPAIVGNPLALG